MENKSSCRKLYHQNTDPQNLSILLVEINPGKPSSSSLGKKKRKKKEKYLG